MKLLPLTLVSVLLIPALSHSDMSDDDMFDLSLGDLLKLNISTVSKRSELSLNSPGIISVISAEEIKTFGARNIKDVLQRTTNLYIADSSTFTANTITMRAGATQHLNNHVLYLINGRPIRESQNGGLHTDINLLFPAEALERIEIVRGPGSVLYGSNAFSGVINFITKKPKKSLGGKLNYQHGTHGFNSYSAALESDLGGDGSVYAIFNASDTDGEVFSAADESGFADSRRQLFDGDNVFIDINYKGLSFSTIQSDTTHPLFGGAFRWPNDAVFQYKRAFYDLGYEHQFTDVWSGSVNYTSNEGERLIAGPGSSSSEFLANGYLYEATIHGKLSEKINLVTGVVVDYLRGDLFTRGGSYRTKRTGTYAQLDYQLLTDAKITAGLQRNELDGGHSDLSPRLALNYRFDRQWTAKLLYSEAFRSPYGSENFFDAVFLQGDATLKPESITTYEAQTSYSEHDYFVSATYYSSETQNAIGRAIVSGTNTFVNESGEVTFDGVELEASWKVNSRWQLKGNYSFQNSENGSGENNVTLAPRKMMKLGVSYHSDRGYSIGLWNNYIGESNKIEDQAGNAALVVNPSAGAINLLSLNLNANAGRFFDRPSLKGLGFSVYANNLLGEESYFPELGRKRVNTYPQSNVKGIYGTLKFSF